MKQLRTLSLLSTSLICLLTAYYPTASDNPVGIVAKAANSQTFTYGDFEYSYTPGSDEATLTKYLGSDTSVTISAWVPSPNGWKTVTKIGDEAFVVPVQFQNNPDPMNIYSVNIPNTITSIGKKAFFSTPLTSLVIPASVTEIDDQAFMYCESMTTLRIEGTAELGESAFDGCSSLYGIWMNSECTQKSDISPAFSDCSELVLLNGSRAYTTSFDSHGWQKPKLTTNSTNKQLIREFFTSALNVKFVNTYCTTLCNYIVNSETRSWMSEAVKARQLFQWMIDHCHFEPDNTEFYKPNNQIFSSVFLSYGLDGEGESVCAGYSKAYQMLMTAAGIESYIVESNLNDYGLSQMSPEELAFWGISGNSRGGHAWNLIKADGNYYQCDTSISDSGNFGFGGFMLTDFEMFNFHENKYNSTKISTSANSHPYMNYSFSAGCEALRECVYSFNDIDNDGLLDGDWNFDGYTSTMIDAMFAYYKAPLAGISSQSELLNELLDSGQTPSEWYNSAV